MSAFMSGRECRRRALGESRFCKNGDSIWIMAVGALMLAALLALGTSFAVADDGATPSSSSSAPSAGSAGEGSGEGATPGGSGDGTGGSPVIDEEPGSTPGGGVDDPHKYDIYDGQIPDYNQDSLTLSISMGTGYVTLEPGQSTSISCVVDPHQGILVTEQNGTFIYDATAYATCSDPSVVRASYDLGSDTLTLEAYEPGVATVTVGANLVYASPVSASVTVEVLDASFDDGSVFIGDDEDGDSDDGDGGGVIGGKGDADTNVKNGTGTGDGVDLGPGASSAQNPFEKPAAAAPASSSTHATVTMPELVAQPETPEEIEQVEEVTDIAEVAPSITLYELEEVKSALGQSLADKMPLGFTIGVWLAVLAFVLLGGGEMYASFRRRLA